MDQRWIAPSGRQLWFVTMCSIPWVTLTRPRGISKQTHFAKRWNLLHSGTLFRVEVPAISHPLPTPSLSALWHFALVADCGFGASNGVFGLFGMSFQVGATNENYTVLSYLNICCVINIPSRCYWGLHVEFPNSSACFRFLVLYFDSNHMRLVFRLQSVSFQNFFYIYNRTSKGDR